MVVPFIDLEDARKNRERIARVNQEKSEQEHPYVNAHYGRIGRPKVLPDQYCKECGKAIDVRPYRRKQGGGNYCRECSEKLFKPPTPVWKDGQRVKKEGAIVVAEANSVKVPSTPTPLEGYEPAAEAHLAKDARPSDRLGYGLHLLKEDTIKAFTQDFEQRLSQYGGRAEVAYDVYMEVLCERNDLENIAKILQHWNKYLDALPECQHTRGAKSVLLSLTELCSAIDKMKPQESNDNAMVHPISTAVTMQQPELKVVQVAALSSSGKVKEEIPMTDNTADFVLPVMKAIVEHKEPKEIIKVGLEAKMKISQRINRVQKEYALCQAIIDLCNLEDDDKKIADFYNARITCQKRTEGTTLQ